MAEAALICSVSDYAGAMANLAMLIEVDTAAAATLIVWRIASES